MRAITAEYMVPQFWVTNISSQRRYMHVQGELSTTGYGHIVILFFYNSIFVLNFSIIILDPHCFPYQDTCTIQKQSNKKLNPGHETYLPVYLTYVGYLGVPYYTVFVESRCSEVWIMEDNVSVGHKAKTNVFSDFPTDSPFSRPPTQVFFIVRLKVFLLRIIYTKNDVNLY